MFFHLLELIYGNRIFYKREKNQLSSDIIFQIIEFGSEAKEPTKKYYLRSVYSEYCSYKIKQNCNCNEFKNSDDQKQLRYSAGQMLWVSSKTQPDMTFEVYMICNTVKIPTMKMVEANKAITKVKSRTLQLTFGAIDDAKKMEVFSYSNATHASLDHGASQGAHIIHIKVVINAPT